MARHQTSKTTKIILGIFAGLIALLVIIGVAMSGHSTGGGASNTPPPPTTTQPAEPSTPPPASTVPSAPPSTPATPSMTVAQEQAVTAAQGYLSMGSGFSKAGLIDQLSSSAGDGFAKADAEFAAQYLHPDWNAQAVESAKGYVEMGGFSRASLIDQLTSSAGDQYTMPQAEYAATQVGL